MLVSDGSISYAGNFLVVAEGRVRLVPDPSKTLIKLGRTDMYCEDHVREPYISFADNNQQPRETTCGDPLQEDSAEHPLHVVDCELLAHLARNRETFTALIERKFAVGDCRRFCATNSNLAACFGKRAAHLHIVEQHRPCKLLHTAVGLPACLRQRTNAGAFLRHARKGPGTAPHTSGPVRNCEGQPWPNSGSQR